MKDTTLVIMAAGIGSRFGGGIKQLAPVGPNGEIIMDYSIRDALEAGFNKIIFIIRKDLEKDFREIIGNRIEKIARVEYAFQELEELPAGYQVPAGRTKPWGTGQAVLAVKGMVHEMDTESDVYDMCMGGFILENTLSENGTVTRGVCQVNEDGTLRDVTETFDIEWKDGSLKANDEQGNPVSVNPDQHVSMNMWGLPPRFLEELETGFPEFLDNIPEGNLKAEYLLPRIIDKLIKSGKGKVKVLETRDKWFGVTYQEDKAAVVDSIRRLIEEGVYKEKLYD